MKEKVRLMNMPFLVRKGRRQEQLSSAVHRVITYQDISAPISLSSISLYNNSLLSHIEKFNLGFRERSPIAGDGNCWFSSLLDLAIVHNLKVPDDANLLRIAVKNSFTEVSMVQKFVSW